MGINRTREIACIAGLNPADVADALQASGGSLADIKDAIKTAERERRQCKPGTRAHFEAHTRVKFWARMRAAAEIIDRR